MGWKYEVETYFYEDDPGWSAAYQGNSLLQAIRALITIRRTFPGRAYRLVIR